jgi:hypothetical protein
MIEEIIGKSLAKITDEAAKNKDRLTYNTINAVVGDISSDLAKYISKKNKRDLADEKIDDRDYKFRFECAVLSFINSGRSSGVSKIENLFCYSVLSEISACERRKEAYDKLVIDTAIELLKSPSSEFDSPTVCAASLNYIFDKNQDKYSKFIAGRLGSVDSSSYRDNICCVLEKLDERLYSVIKEQNTVKSLGRTKCQHYTKNTQLGC